MTINIHGKEYKTVAERVNEFRKDEITKSFCISTEIVSIDDNKVLMKASIIGPEGLLATGYAEEDRNASRINKTSALENCETSAVGRALANFGLAGTEFASADEVSNAIINQHVQEAVNKIIIHNQAVKDNIASIFEVKQALAEGNYDVAAECMRELSDETRQALNLAPTKGGIFTVEENKQFRTDEYSQAVKRFFEEN